MTGIRVDIVYGKFTNERLGTEPQNIVNYTYLIKVNRNIILIKRCKRKTDTPYSYNSREKDYDTLRKVEFF